MPRVSAPQQYGLRGRACLATLCQQAVEAASEGRSERKIEGMSCGTYNECGLLILRKLC